MLPNKQYFHVSAIVPSHQLHDIMLILGKKRAYNVEVVAYEPEGTNKVSPQAKPGERRDFEEVKHRILELLKKGPQETVYLLENAGAPGNRPILYRMLAAKQIKKAGKGKYKL